MFLSEKESKRLYSLKNSVKKPTAQQVKSMEEILEMKGGKPLKASQPSRLTSCSKSAVCFAPRREAVRLRKGTAVRSPVREFEKTADIRIVRNIEERKFIVFVCSFISKKVRASLVFR